MGFFSKLFGPSDDEIIGYIERYEDLERNSEQETEEDAFVRAEIYDVITEHGWYQQRRWGHLVWNKE